MLLENREILHYLDNVIEGWRERKIRAITELEKLCCSCYVDAYQSVRISIFGKEKE